MAFITISKSRVRLLKYDSLVKIGIFRRVSGIIHDLSYCLMLSYILTSYLLFQTVCILFQKCFNIFLF